MRIYTYDGLGHDPLDSGGRHGCEMGVNFLLSLSFGFSSELKNPNKTLEMRRGKEERASFLAVCFIEG